MENKNLMVGFAAGAVASLLLAHVWTPAMCQQKAKPKHIKLTYFNIEGVAEKVRLALVFYGVPFEDHRISFADWGAMKPQSKYGVLPEMMVDGEVIGQSNAMLMYAGALGDGSLYPEGPMRMKIDEVIGLAGDLDRAWMPAFYLGMRPQFLGYPEDFNKTEDGQKKVKEMRSGFMDGGFHQYMGYYTKLLERSQFFCGPSPTIADCYILPQLKRFVSGQIDHVDKSCMDKYPLILAWIARMQAVPQFNAWYAKK